MSGWGDSTIKPYLSNDLNIFSQDACMAETEDMATCDWDTSTTYEEGNNTLQDISTEKYPPSTLAYFSDPIEDADYLEEPADMDITEESYLYEEQTESCGVFPDTCDHSLGLSSGAPVVAGALAVAYVFPPALAVSILAHAFVLPILFYNFLKVEGNKEEQYIEVIHMADNANREEESITKENDEIKIAENLKPEKSAHEKIEKPKKEEIKKEKKKKEIPEEEEKEMEEVEIELVQLENSGLHFVDIQNNETDKPPANAKYFAPINSIVEEETRALRTNLDHDDGESTPPEKESIIDDEKPGDAPVNLSAHEIEEPEDPPLQEKGDKNDPEEEVYYPQTKVTTVPSEEGKESEPFQEPPQESISSPTEEETPVEKPKPLTPDNAPPLHIAISENGEFIDTETGEPIKSISEIQHEKQKKSIITKDESGSGDESKGPGADINLSYVQLDGLFGVQLEEDKRAYEAAKKSKTKGGFTKNIDKVMSQLENFNPDVKPGNQTALNAAYHPFAKYITAFHRKLHPQWGDGYIASLMNLPSSHSHNDMSLFCKLEIVINSDGSIEKITVVRHSGRLAYDVAAIDAVYDGAPYPPPPDIIKSYNGKTYFRWGFHRDCNQCGVWLAEPYIITDPEASKTKVKKPQKETPPVK